MGQNIPFFRNSRCFMEGHYGNTQYIHDTRYAKEPQHYIRAFMLIQKDLLNLFDYIEPSDKNLATHSFRVGELLFRTCVEIEANFKAILKENGYKSNRNLNIDDYQELNPSHRLSSFVVKLPCWRGIYHTICPFDSFSVNKSPNWYKAYNDVKHDRLKNFEKASFKNLIESVCGLVAVLSSQFHREDFDSINYAVFSTGTGDGFETAIGKYFLVKFPTDWPDEEKYDFMWSGGENKDKKFKKLFQKARHIKTHSMN